MFKNLTLTFLLVFFATIGCFSQVYSTNLDSLKAKLPGLQDKELVDAYLEVARLSFELNNELDSALFYATMAFNKSEKIKYVGGAISSLSYSGVALTRQGNIEKSNECWNKALQIALLAKDEQNVADLESKIGYNYHSIEDYENATVHYLKATVSMERLKDYSNLSVTYANLAVVFGSLLQQDQCLFYIRKSINQIPKHDDEYSKVIAYSGAMNEMLDIGLTESNYIDSALVYGNLGLKLALKNDYKSRIALFYVNLSELFDLKGDTKKSTEAFLKSVEYRQYMTQNYLLNYYFRAIRFYSTNNQNPIALSYLDSAEVYVKEYDHDFYSFRFYEELYNVNKNLGNYRISLNAIESMHLYEAKLLDEKRNLQITKIQQQFNKVQNEKVISELNQEKIIFKKNEQIDNLKINLLVIGSILLAALVALIFFIYKKRVNKEKKKLMEVELRLNRSRMNPHFFFNALTSIQTLSLQERNFNEVPFYISKFSKVMRSLLESTYTEMVVLEDEIDFIKKYLDVQQLYLDNKFEYIVSVDDKILTSEYKIPPMLLQPFMENSIEHGFKNMQGVGVIEINFIIAGSELCINIKDNGIGFNNDSKHKSYPSRAMQIIKDRLYLFNQKYKSHADYTMVNLPESKGVIVTIYLPLIHLK